MGAKIKKSLISELIICLILTTYFNSANSMQVNYSLEGGMEYTDNATLISTDPISSAIRRFDVIADINHSSNTVSFVFRPRINVYNYQNDLLNDQTFYYLDSSLLFEIIPNGFRWSFDDYLGQTTIDVADPVTPFNTQTTNAFLTGPDFIFKFNNTNRIELLLRYADIYYELEDLDNERYGGLLKLVSEPNNYAEYSLNLDSADIKYDNTVLNENYTRNDLYFTVKRLTNVATISLDAGYTRIDREISNELNGFIGKFESQININSRSNLNVYAHAQYTDSSRNFLQSRLLREELRVYDTQISPDIFYEKYIYAGYDWRDDANTINIELSKANQDYKEPTNELDRTIKRASISFNRSITRLTSLYFTAIWQNSYYSSVFVDDKDNDYLLGIDYRLSRSFVFRIGLGHRERNSNDIIRNYEENHGFMSIRFSNSR